MSSSMLEQAIIDAKELKESAQRNAEETIVEKYQSEIKEAVEKILEQDDLGLGGAMGGLGTPASGKPESAKQPEAGEDQIDMVLKQLPFIQTTDDNQFIELDLTKLEESLNIVSEVDEEAFEEEFEIDEDEFEVDAEDLGLDEELELDEEMLEEDELDELIVMGKKGKVQMTPEEAKKEGYLEELSLEEMVAEALEDMLSERPKPRPAPNGKYTGPKPKPKKKRLPTEKEIDDMFGQNIDEDLFEVEDLEEKLGDGKTQGTDSKDAGLDDNEEFTRMDLAAEKGGKRGPGKKKKKIKNPKTPKENKTLIKEQTRMSSKVQLLENKLDKYGTVIDQLKQKLDESNLASAKLLYQNRVLDSVSLNERQKNRIVEAIKDAETVEEAKIIFETLQSTVETTGKTSRTRESLNEVVYRGSSAFMPLKEDKQKVSDPFVARMKTLAGLK